MDAGIGSAAGIAADALLAGHRGDGLLQRLLHGAQPRLGLPTAELGAVVGEDEADVAHFGEW
jgi:hypothetical protein